MVRMAVDIGGADTPQEELCRGALAALGYHPDLYLYLCGKEEAIAPLLAQKPAGYDRCELVASPDVITNNDNPMAAYRCTESSLVRAFTLARDGVADGVITCGATGAVLTCAVTILGRLQGLRPILAVELINKDGAPLLLLDAGANIDSRPELYPSFARLGDAYMKSIGIPDPRIALLSNGAEDKKGCAAVKEANVLLHEAPLHFVGNIEATRALLGETDVIVCDGFHGNILLKSIEGTAKAVLAEVEAGLPAATPEVRGVLNAVRRKYDYNTQGGALLLGVKKPLMKGHGSATGEAVTHMIDRTCDLVRGGFVERVSGQLTQE